MQYFNLINKTCFVLTLIIFRNATVSGQVEINSLYRISFDSLSSTYINLDFKKNKYLNTFEIPPITLKLKETKKNFFIRILNEGAILCFEDSMLEKPILLKKRNLFPFTILDKGQKYSLQISNQLTFKGFVGIRLVWKGKKELIDEVFFCLPEDFGKIEYEIEK